MYFNWMYVVYRAYRAYRAYRVRPMHIMYLHEMTNFQANRYRALLLVHQAASPPTRSPSSSSVHSPLVHIQSQLLPTVSSHALHRWMFGERFTPIHAICHGVQTVNSTPHPRPRPHPRPQLHGYCYIATCGHRNKSTQNAIVPKLISLVENFYLWCYANNCKWLVVQ